MNQHATKADAGEKLMNQHATKTDAGEKLINQHATKTDSPQPELQLSVQQCRKTHQGWLGNAVNYRTFSLAPESNDPVDVNK